MQLSRKKQRAAHIQPSKRACTAQGTQQNNLSPSRVKHCDAAGAWARQNAVRHNTAMDGVVRDGPNRLQAANLVGGCALAGCRAATHHNTWVQAQRVHGNSARHQGACRHRTTPMSHVAAKQVLSPVCYTMPTASDMLRTWHNHTVYISVLPAELRQTKHSYSTRTRTTAARHHTMRLALNYATTAANYYTNHQNAADTHPPALATTAMRSHTQTMQPTELLCAPARPSDPATTTVWTLQRLQ